MNLQKDKYSRFNNHEWCRSAQDDLHIGFIGTHGNRIANMILNQCDLIVSVGARLGIRQVGRDHKNFAPKLILFVVILMNMN